MNIIIATIKSWNIQNALELKKKFNNKYDIYIVDNPANLTIDIVKKINPEYIFFPHWSNIIPKEIYEEFQCIVFHMTDLPYGRGGSPLQNLIVRGIENTKISAIKVTEQIDAGSIYLKSDLNLNGSADEIYLRASNIIFHCMIPQIMSKEIELTEQTGKVTIFKRRKPEESRLREEMTLNEIYDYIRMLDGEEYPNAYIKLGKNVLRFSRASLKNGKIIADVEIMEE